MKDLIKEFAEVLANKIVENPQFKNFFDRGAENNRELKSILLNTKQASEYYHVSIGTIRNWISNGELKSKRVGSRLYVIVEPVKAD